MEDDVLDIDKLLASSNIAEDLEQNILDEIGEKCIDDFEEDLTSRGEWEESNDDWLKLATQVMEEKNYPWPGASNVKFPLLATAALQFHARAYPALIPDSRVVKTRVMGKDGDGSKLKRANRISQHMSYQLLHQMDGWQEDMDRMLYILPIIGVAFKKTYYSLSKKANVSELVLPTDLVINYFAPDFMKARKSHRLLLNDNEILEYQNEGIYLQDVTLPDAEDKQHDSITDELVGLSPSIPADDMPHEIIEQHCYYDLDDDGYKEPYIVTVDRESRKVLRIVARWESDGVQTNVQGDLVKIIPLEYFTHYSFIPNPSSKIYSLGFGSLIGPTNQAINTILNQLLDAGHLSTLGGGFLGRGARVRGGRLSFKPGEWKAVQATGDDLRKSIYPMPVKEPSAVLFNLLGLLIDSGERLASVKDIMVGENPGQNQPYSTTVAVMEQGMKVFVSIYKRIFRALDKEFKKLYKLNSMYLEDEEYFVILDSEEEGIVARSDYNGDDKDIIPGADPSSISEAQKMMKADSLLQKLNAGLPLNVGYVTRKVLEAEGHEDIEELMNVPQPEPDFEMKLQMDEFEHKKQMDLAELELRRTNSQFEPMKDQAQATSLMAKAEATSAAVERDDVAKVMDFTIRKEDQKIKKMEMLSKSLMEEKQIEESNKTEE